MDLGANLAVTRQVLKPHGVIAVYASMAAPESPLPVYPLMMLNATVRGVLVCDMPQRAERRSARS